MHEVVMHMSYSPLQQSCFVPSTCRSWTITSRDSPPFEMRARLDRHLQPVGSSEHDLLYASTCCLCCHGSGWRGRMLLDSWSLHQSLVHCRPANDKSPSPTDEPSAGCGMRWRVCIIEHTSFVVQGHIRDINTHLKLEALALECLLET